MRLARVCLPACPLAMLFGSLTAQDDMMDPRQVHPRANISLGVGFGDQTNETNIGTQIVSRSTSAYYFRLRGEYFFESDFGVYFNGYVGMADDINEDLGSPDSDQDNAGAFLAVSYYAKMNDDFRMPVRFGPFFQSVKIFESTIGLGQDTDYQTIGVRLSVEPEYIIFQKASNGRISELSAFLELSCGAGPTDYDAKNPDNGTPPLDPSSTNGSEDGYAFTFSWELGVRYRLASGITASLSYYAQKYHIGTSESYNSLVFYGVDDDFNGVMVSLGYRF